MAAPSAQCLVSMATRKQLTPLKTPDSQSVGHRAEQGNHRLLKPICAKHLLAAPVLQLLFEGLPFPRRPKDPLC